MSLYDTAEKVEILKESEINFINISLKYTLEIGREAMKSAILINGALAIAVLAFVGSVYEKVHVLHVIYFYYSLAIAATGVFSAVSAIGLTYFSQAHYTISSLNSFFENDKARKHEKNGDLLRFFAIIFVFISYNAFIWGAMFGLFGIIGKINYSMIISVSVMEMVLAVVVVLICYVSEKH